MPAYSFQSCFAEPIVAGTKGGTIRLPRNIRGDSLKSEMRRRNGGHGEVGQTLYLYTGMRTRHCRKIGEHICVGLEPITLDLKQEQVTLHRSGIVFASPSNLDTFAIFDGFSKWSTLWGFWKTTHPSVEFFEGWHIRWLALPTDIAELARNMAPFVEACA